MYFFLNGVNNKYKHIVKYYTEHAYGGNWANWGL